MSNHLKSLAAPRTWRIERKKKVFTLKPSPGGHPIYLSMPIGLLIRHLGFAETSKEARHILNTQEVLVDGRRVKKQDYPVGLMDVVSFPSIKKHYRMIINKKGMLELIPIEEREAGIKPCKIKNKTAWKGKIQLNLSDGKNIVVDKDSYKRGDSLMISLPKNEIISHLSFEKGASIMIINGKNMGHIGTVEKIEQDKVFYKEKSSEVKETAKDYAYVIGKEKPEIKLP